MEISVEVKTRREDMLARIRGRLAGSAPGQWRAELPAVPAALPQPALVAQFTAAVEQIGGHVYRVPGAEASAACEQLVKIVHQCQPRRVVYADVPALGDLVRGIARDEFEFLAVTSLVTLRDMLAQTDVGLTDADYAIAETGTLVLFQQPGRPSLLTALPAVHIAVIRAEQIVASFADLVPAIRTRATQISHTTLITGPSRTGDIEQVITIGAHGPRELHVVVREG